MTLVDSNIIVDILTGDSDWLEWSGGQLEQRREAGSLYINEITFAELAVRAIGEAELQDSLKELGVQLERTPTAALFMAGKTFGRYRAAGGLRTSVLPDFFIGAHAQAARLPILTRDTRRYRTYFPEVMLISPDT
jgi:predicted nucleic acid-binding protein